MPPVPEPAKPAARANRNLLIAIAVAATVAGALIVGSLLFTRDDDEGVTATTAQAATATAPTDAAPSGTTSSAISLVAGIPQAGTVLGNPAATVRLLQFEDLQCPICKAFTDDAFPAIVEEYVRPGRVKIDFRGLAFLGPDSAKALRIAFAAAVKAEATALQVPGTPRFYIGAGLNQPSEFSPPSLTPEAFRPVLDQALKG